MKAVVQHSYGRADDVLTLREIDKPAPRDNEVLVRVRAASMHPDVWHAVNGLPLAFRLMGSGIARPKQPVPGTDVAGFVASIGKTVTRFKPGDEVFGATVYVRVANGGTYAEFAVAPEDMLAHKPRNVTFEQAASVPTPGFITLMNLRPDRLAPGHEVLINGAGGNVGSLAVQMAKARGARVTGVDGAHKLELIRSFGADRVIDYTREDFTLGSERYDLIFDVASTLSVPACQRVLKPNGRYWIIGHDHFGKASGRVLGSIPRMMGFMVRQLFDSRGEKLKFDIPPVKDLIEVLRQQLESGQLAPIVARTFSLSEVPAGMRCLEEGSAQGCIVIVPSAAE